MDGHQDQHDHAYKARLRQKKKEWQSCARANKRDTQRARAEAEHQETLEDLRA